MKLSDAELEPFRLGVAALTGTSSQREPPAVWVDRRLREGLHAKQREIAESVVANRRTAVPSCFGSGKSHLASRLACWWIETHPPGEAIVVTTATSWTQVRAILWQNIARAHATGHLIGRVNQTEWWIGDLLVGFGRRPPNWSPDAFTGIHLPYVLVIIDEACHDAETEVLTEHGWMRFADLRGTEALLTMDPATKRAEYRLPTRVIAKPYDGPLIHYRQRGADFCVTPDHRMLVRSSKGRERMVRAADLPVNNHTMHRNVDWAAGDVETIQLDSVALTRAARLREPLRLPMDPWLALAGWFGAEGSLAFSRGVPQGIRITHTDDATLDEIAGLCRDMGLRWQRIHHGIHVQDRRVAEHLAQFGRYQHERRVPSYVRRCSPRQMRLYLEGYLRGDGYHKGRRDIIYTSSERMAGDLQELWILTGEQSTVTQRMTSGAAIDGREIPESKGWVVARAAQRSSIKLKPGKTTTVYYHGTVYCATVPPHHLLFTRRNGVTLWSGNSGVPKDIFDACDGLVTNEDSRLLAIGNPYGAGSHFAHVCRPSSTWHVVNVSAFDCPAFTGEAVSDIARRSLVSKLWVEEVTAEWGTDSPLFQSKVLGQFPEESDDQLISLSHVAAARAHEAPRDDAPVIGVDVARFGEDETVIAARWGWHVEILETFRRKPTTYTSGAVLRHVRELGCRDVRVDDDGIGGAVTDMLREEGVTVDALHNGGSPADPSKYVDARSEWWWRLRQAFIARDPDIPDDDTLAAQLTSIRYGLDRRGRIKVESKDEMRKRGVRSPDRADGVLYTIATSRTIAPVVAPVAVPQVGAGAWPT